MKMCKTIGYDEVMKAVLHNLYVDCWGRLYEALGVYDWFEARGKNPDVKNIYMTERFRQYVDSVLSDKYATGKRGLGIPGYMRRQSSMDSVCYSPTSIEDTQDCIILDLTGKTEKKKSKEYIDYMPKLIKRGIK